LLQEWMTVLKAKKLTPKTDTFNLFMFLNYLCYRLKN
jgi:hypothetical protein